MQPAAGHFPPGGYQAASRPTVMAPSYNQPTLASPVEPAYVSGASPQSLPLSGQQSFPSSPAAVVETVGKTGILNSKPVIIKPTDEVKVEPPKNQTKAAAQNFFELYKALNDDDYNKMTTCSYCQRKFRFTSVLIEHLASHTPSVEKIVEMKLKIWINGSKLKCTEVGCKKKFAYTLEYTKHRDNHQYSGLTCSLCGSAQAGPALYAAHLKSEHREQLFSTETQPEDLLPPPSSKRGQLSESPSPAPAPGPEAVLSPAVLLSNPRTPGSSSELQLQQVHTPQSAPPVMTASPGHLSHLGPLSPQQPMSAPPTTQFSEDLDFTAAINMPIIEDQALTPPAQTVINNKETEEFMSILNDLKDCTSTPPFESDPSGSNSQTNPEIFPGVEIPEGQMMEATGGDSHPIILSQRAQSEHCPSSEEYQDLTAPPYPGTARPAGVIKRNPSISENQPYTPSPVAAPVETYPAQITESAQSTPGVRALVAQTILRRKSRSSSFDSSRSEAPTGKAGESLSSIMMTQSTSHNQNSVITRRQSAELELENLSNQNQICSFNDNFNLSDEGGCVPPLEAEGNQDSRQSEQLLNSAENYNGKNER